MAAAARHPGRPPASYRPSAVVPGLIRRRAAICLLPRSFFTYVSGRRPDGRAGSADYSAYEFILLNIRCAVLPVATVGKKNLPASCRQNGHVSSFRVTTTDPLHHQRKVCVRGGSTLGSLRTVRAFSEYSIELDISPHHNGTRTTR